MFWLAVRLPAAAVPSLTPEDLEAAHFPHLSRIKPE